MPQIAIVGTGGMGRETLAWLMDAPGRPEVLGFLDDEPARHGSSVAGQRVLGDLSWLAEAPEAEVVIALGNPARREHVHRQLRAGGIDLATVVHPTATIGPGVILDSGVIVCPQAVLTCDVRVGAAAIVNYGAMIGHDGVVGAYAFVGPGCHIAGNVTIGEQASVGIGASVIQGVTIGPRAVVGAGAAVIRDVPADTTVVGVPARPLEGR